MIKLIISLSLSFNLDRFFVCLFLILNLLRTKKLLKKNKSAINPAKKGSKNKLEFKVIEMSQETMNGLLQFIKDIRQCKNKEDEQARVAKELAKIRGKFENKGISGYQRKKYVWKMLYMYILGYEIDFGHFQAANLINSSKFSEKYTGYIATGKNN